jgi:hypothetical protein
MHARVIFRNRYAIHIAPLSHKIYHKLHIYVGPNNARTSATELQERPAQVTTLSVSPSGNNLLAGWKETNNTILAIDGTHPGVRSRNITPIAPEQLMLVEAREEFSPGYFHVSSTTTTHATSSEAAAIFRCWLLRNRVPHLSF